MHSAAEAPGSPRTDVWPVIVTCVRCEAAVGSKIMLDTATIAFDTYGGVNKVKSTAK